MSPVLKVKDAAGVWKDIAGTGTVGPPGGPVPVGGLPGEVIQKTGAADFEVGWVQRPRVAGSQIVAQVTTHASGGNNLVEACSMDIVTYPDRVYHIFAGWRCISDPGAVIATGHAAVAFGTVNLAQWDEVTTADTGLWGSWSQNWLEPGTTFTATQATLRLRLSVGCTVAARIIYSPRLYCIEY